MKKIFQLFVLLSFAVFAQPVINGDLSESEYVTIAVKLNGNNGFGDPSIIDVSKIVYYPDIVNSILYLGLQGKLYASNSNGIGLFINVAGTGSPTGIAAGNSLGFSGAGHYMDGDVSINQNFKADFEVDYMFAFNPANTSTKVDFDASKLVGGSVAEYQGSCDQIGTSATNSNASGGVFTQDSINFAFNNTGGTNKGLEISIPFSQIGTSSSMNISAFAFLVGPTGLFSNVTVPGNFAGTNNIGTNADFSILNGGPWHSIDAALPVELSLFTVKVLRSGGIKLDWRTETEVSHYGFEVHRAEGNSEFRISNFEIIGFVEGHGNSNSPKDYSFTDNSAGYGKYSYRLKQIDTDGQFEYSKVIEVNAGNVPGGFILEQNYPNPFNPTTTIKFAVVETQKAELKVFDLLGNEVAILFNGIAEGGKLYEAEFSGETLSSGIYFYRLETERKFENKKMLLLK